MLWAGGERTSAVLCGLGARTADPAEMEIAAKINLNAKKPQKMCSLQVGVGFVLSWMVRVAPGSVTFHPYSTLARRQVLPCELRAAEETTK